MCLLIIDMSAAPYNCVSDGAMDCSPAFDAAIDAIKTRQFVFGQYGQMAYGGSIPGGGGTIVWPAKPGPDGLYRPYRMSRQHKLYSRMRVVGEGPHSCLMWDAGVSAIAFDAGFIQSQEDLRIEDISIQGRALRPAGFNGSYAAWYAASGRPSGVGDVAIHCQGGALPSIRRCVVGGFDRALVLDGTEHALAEGNVISTWNAEAFVTARIGVHFAARPQGGGITNQNTIRNSQFQSLIGIQHDDGATNLVEGCNFNAPHEMLRITGAQSLTVRGCMTEGIQGDTVIRCGPVGGTQAGLIAWQSLAIENCEITLGGPLQPALLRTEIGCQGQATSFAGTRILGGRLDANGHELGAIAAGMGGPDPYVYLTGKWTPPLYYDGGPVDHVVGAWYAPPDSRRTRGLWAHRPYWGASLGIVPPYAGPQ